MDGMTPCQHCHATGTCANGPAGQSCACCTAYWRRRRRYRIDIATPTGLICSVCRGTGITEVASAKWGHRYPAFMAIGIVVPSLILLLVLGLTRCEYFNTLLVFVGTLIGCIAGFYFGGERAGRQHKSAPMRLSGRRRSVRSRRETNEISGEEF